MTHGFAKRAGAVALTLASLALPGLARAQDSVDLSDLTPTAVDRLSFSGSVLGGVEGTYDNIMALGSATMPLSSRISAQVDFGAGSYRSEYFAYTAGARVFWRYEGLGVLGFYADYANVDPEHAGRFGVEGAYYFDRVTIEALLGVRTGTNVYDAGFDEIDVSYYITDDLRASIGHRSTSRGQVGNIGVEYAPRALGGWTFFGEAEAGEDDNHSAFAGLRFTFGDGRYASLIERDRSGPMRTRVPRNIVDVTRCGELPEKQSASFGHRDMSILCASKDELDAENARESKKE